MVSMTPEKSYELTTAEREQCQRLNTLGVQIKARAFDAQAQLALAQNELSHLQREFDGILNAMRAAHGFVNGGLTQDFARLVGAALPTKQDALAPKGAAEGPR
jgi:DNA anti-recombination protein RmuC